VNLVGDEWGENVETDSAAQWQQAFEAYRRLVCDPEMDSEYLRRTGLVPHLTELMGDVSKLWVLDAGCGNGWLFDAVTPLRGYECDIVTPPGRRLPHLRSHYQDIRSLTYDDETFDLVVSSLVLMWVDELDRAFDEAYRVTRPGGRMIVGITHPYFSLNGRALHDGTFLVEQSVACPHQRNVMISRVVGPVTYFSRPLVDYYNAALRARWRLVGFRDHFIDMDRYRLDTAGRASDVRRTGNVPLFTFFVCQKNNLSV